MSDNFWVEFDEFPTAPGVAAEPVDIDRVLGERDDRFRPVEPFPRQWAEVPR